MAWFVAAKILCVGTRSSPASFPTRPGAAEDDVDPGAGGGDPSRSESVEHAAFLPTIEAALMIRRDGCVVKPCRDAWRRNNRGGAAFMSCRRRAPRPTQESSGPRRPGLDPGPGRV